MYGKSEEDLEYLFKYHEKTIENLVKSYYSIETDLTQEIHIFLSKELKKFYEKVERGDFEGASKKVSYLLNYKLARMTFKSVIKNYINRVDRKYYKLGASEKTIQTLLKLDKESILTEEQKDFIEKNSTSIDCSKDFMNFGNSNNDNIINFCLEYLNKDDSEIFNLFFIEGYSDREIATKLNSSKSSIHRRRCEIIDMLKYVILDVYKFKDSDFCRSELYIETHREDNDD